MDFLSKLINRPKSLVVSSADQMDSAANGVQPQTRPLSTSKKLLAADRTKDTIQHTENINIEGVENRTKEEVEYFPTATLSSVTEEGQIEDEKNKESSWIKSVSPLTILPDIINVQPIAVKEDTKKSHILTTTSDDHSTTIELQGNSTLTVPSIACDAVSSDEDNFAECLSYVEQQMPLEDEFNRSVHWNTMLSNVTSSNIENLENIEHTTEQGATESPLDFELSQELEAEHEVHNECVGCVQSSTGSISQIREELNGAKTAKPVSHSPDSTLNHNIPESINSADLDKTVDLKTICKDMISLCYDNEILKANASSSISPPITPEKECSDSVLETEKVQQSLKSPELNCFDSPNSSPNVTSTIEEECKVSGEEETCSVPNSANNISMAKNASGWLDRNVQLPKVALEYKESLEQEMFSPKLKLETTFSTNQLNTTFGTTGYIADLNQTDQLSEDIVHGRNTYVDQLNTSANIQLEQCLFNIKSDVAEIPNQRIAVDASKIMDQTIVVNTSEIMDQTIVVDASKLMGQTIIGNENAQFMDMDHIHGLPSTERTMSTKSPGKPDNIFMDELMNPMDVTFKPPPIIAAQKRRSKEPSSDSDFQGHGFILNPSDFDFLLSKSSNFEPVDDRSSVLLRFDPLVGHPVPVNQSQVYNPSLPTATEEQEPEVNSNRNSNQLSGVLTAKEVKSSSNIVHSETPLKNVLLKNIIKEPEPIPKSKPLVLQSFNASTELIQSDDKMSVDVIQGLDIGNDSKSEENLRQKTGNMDDMEKKIKNEVLKTEDIEKKLKDAEQREEALLKRITEKDKTIAKMSGVIEAYEKAIAELIAEKEQIIQNYEKQMSEIKSERDLNYKHLTSLESTFTDLHAKYERSKQLTAKLKSSEEELKQEKKQNLENLRLQEQRYEKMKSHAMQQLEIANNKLESLQKNHSMEVTRLKALLKKEEISRLSVNEQLQQKTRENEELMKICDELINGQGASS